MEKTTKKAMKLMSSVDKFVGDALADVGLEHWRSRVIFDFHEDEISIEKSFDLVDYCKMLEYFDEFADCDASGVITIARTSRLTHSDFTCYIWVVNEDVPVLITMTCSVLFPFGEDNDFKKTSEEMEAYKKIKEMSFCRINEI